MVAAVQTLALLMETREGVSQLGGHCKSLGNSCRLSKIREHRGGAEAKHSFKCCLQSDPQSTGTDLTLEAHEKSMVGHPLALCLGSLDHQLAVYP